MYTYTILFGRFTYSTNKVIVTEVSNLQNNSLLIKVSGVKNPDNKEVFYSWKILLLSSKGNIKLSNIEPYSFSLNSYQ